MNEQEMYDEWQAWLVVGTELKTLGIDMNEGRAERLVRSIELWGELLVQLRIAQGQDIIDQAMSDTLLKAKVAGLTR